MSPVLLLYTILTITTAINAISENSVNNLQDHEKGSPEDWNEMLPRQYPIPIENEPNTLETVADNAMNNAPYAYETPESDELTENLNKPMNQKTKEQNLQKAPNSMAEVDRGDKLKEPWEDDDSINEDISRQLDTVEKILVD
uniref:Uncharacterized protein n=1 Tax=Trichobilharzia regenti TaxID=157069 RepID=A0AA85JBT4_TRIRE|nr:unnamed protein product [Trichobilharzia regenti]